MAGQCHFVRCKKQLFYAAWSSSLQVLEAMHDGQMTLEVLIRAANNSWGLVFLEVLAR